MTQFHNLNAVHRVFPIMLYDRLTRVILKHKDIAEGLIIVYESLGWETIPPLSASFPIESNSAIFSHTNHPSLLTACYLRLVRWLHDRFGWRGRMICIYGI